jgi:hypothetical protein
MQAAALPPWSLAYGDRQHPWVGIDEGLNSKQVWDAVSGLVGAGLASGAGSLWYEVYRNPDGSIDPLRTAIDFDQAARMQRTNRTLKRLPCTDRDVTSSILNQGTRDGYTHAATWACSRAAIFSTAPVTAGSS